MHDSSQPKATGIRKLELCIRKGILRLEVYLGKMIEAIQEIDMVDREMSR
jgi:hypothetical protein